MKGGLYNPSLRQTATLIVAASDSLYPDRADYFCDGTADNVQIQAALNALPLTGGELLLLDGTYNCAASIILDSYQTLRGCGRNTILTASAADVDIITATGGAGTEKIGILIADLCDDGNAGGVSNDSGIKWTYVDRSRIEGCWARDNAEHGIILTNCDSNTIMGNICPGNAWGGLQLTTSLHNIITGNTCQGNTNVSNGIGIGSSSHNTITGNTCQGNTNYGMSIYSSLYNTITGNTCQGNVYDGIMIYRSSYCTVTGNSCNGQTDAAGDGIYVFGDGTTNADYNTITGNICTDNNDDGIEIAGGANANKNIVLGNQLLGNGDTPLVDGGTATVAEHNIVA